jgi:hypothetical protein
MPVLPENICRLLAIAPHRVGSPAERQAPSSHLQRRWQVEIALARTMLYFLRTRKI